MPGFDPVARQTAENAAVTAAQALAIAGQAQPHAADAASSALTAQQVLAQFLSYYLGAYPSDPAADFYASQNATALQNGLIYWNTTESKFRVYGTTAWADYDASAQQALTLAQVAATQAQNSAAQALSALMALPYFPLLNAANTGTFSVVGGGNVLPQGVTSGTVGGTAVTGATPGSYALTPSGGSFTGVQAHLVVTAATGAPTIIIDNPGRTTSATPTAPTWTNPAGATLPSGTTLTGNIGTQIVSGTGQYYTTSDATGSYLLYWQNTGTGVPVAVLDGAGNQLKFALGTIIAAILVKQNLLYGSLCLWPGGQTPAVAITCPDGTAVALIDGQGHLVTPTATGGFERVFSPQNINGAPALNIAPIAGEQIVSVRYDQWGYVRSATGAKGGKWVDTPTGLVRENSGYFFGPANINGAPALNIAPIAGEQIVSVRYDQWGYVRSATGANGGKWVDTPTGLVRENSGYFFGPSNIKGINSLSFGYVNGEAIAEAAYDQWGYVRSAVGANGGHFLATPTGLQRANANYFTAKPLATTYTGKAYVTSPASVALAYKPAAAGTAYIFVGMGQSNCDGQNNNVSDPYLSSTALYPNNALMLQQGSTQGGPRIRTASGSAVLVPLIEQVINAGGGSYQQETPISGWVNHFISLYNAANGALPTVVGMSVAIGGRAYVGNGRGQVPLELSLQLATTALKAKGFTDIIVVGAWVGSESDTTLTGMNDLWFKRNMRQLRRDFTESCFRICGMQADPEILFIQPDNVVNGTPLFQPARDGQRILDNEYGFTLAGTAYDLPRETSSDTTSNYIHRSNLSKYTTGMRLGIATFYQVANNGAWHGLKPTKAYWTSATTINIEFDGMGVGVSGNSLVLDTSGTITTTSSTYNNALANYGFSFDDGSGSPPAISSVTVSGYIATVTLASAPTGLRKSIGYALTRTALNSAPNNINITDGPIYGARGQLRDSVARTRLADSATQYDWCPAFILNL